MKKKIYIFVLLLIVISFSACAKKITEDQSDKIDVGMDTNRAINILGEGKTTDDRKVIQEKIESEISYNKKQIKKMEKDDSEGVAQFYKDNLVNLKTALHFVEKGYDLKMYSYVLENKDTFDVITTQEKDEDIVTATIYTEK